MFKLYHPPQKIQSATCDIYDQMCILNKNTNHNFCNGIRFYY